MGMGCLNNLHWFDRHQTARISEIQLLPVKHFLHQPLYDSIYKKLSAGIRNLTRKVDCIVIKPKKETLNCNIKRFSYLVSLRYLKKFDKVSLLALPFGILISVRF